MPLGHPGDCWPLDRETESDKPGSKQRVVGRHFVAKRGNRLCEWEIETEITPDVSGKLFVWARCVGHIARGITNPANGRGRWRCVFHLDALPAGIVPPNSSSKK